ncbi:hypothetical protein B0T25DRAFT_616230 [Lasiosphaeria hispida]|uniref:Uncharacterized protein n=1 Tax=Lasiosphaeria hispida TaxID=260671 RepID=A0AAJ0HAP3_9PEZI|nr:hypothetical protein B0T25DRAFT_616230 [Lasiosphaeria hispida]
MKARPHMLNHPASKRRPLDPIDYPFETGRDATSPDLVELARGHRYEGRRSANTEKTIHSASPDPRHLAVGISETPLYEKRHDSTPACGPAREPAAERNERIVRNFDTHKDAAFNDSTPSTGIFSVSGAVVLKLQHTQAIGRFRRIVECFEAAEPSASRRYPEYNRPALGYRSPLSEDKNNGEAEHDGGTPRLRSPLNADVLGLDRVPVYDALCGQVS